MTKCYCEKAVITRAAPFPAISSSSDPYNRTRWVFTSASDIATIVFTDHYVNHSEGINKASKNTIPPHLRQHFFLRYSYTTQLLRHVEPPLSPFTDPSLTLWLQTPVGTPNLSLLSSWTCCACPTHTLPLTGSYCSLYSLILEENVERCEGETS